MERVPQSEYEVIRYEKLRHLHIFLVNVLFRNMHEHSDFELDMILRGSATVRCNRSEVHVKPGSLLLFNSYEPHEIASDTTEPLQILSIQISSQFCKEYFPRLHNVEFTPVDIACELPEQELREISARLFATAICFFREQPGFQLDSVGNVCLMMSQILRLVPHVLIDDQEYAARKRRTARIRRITSYIDQHYKEKIMLPDLAEQEGISTTYLSHFFHETFHMTFQDYLSRLRLEKALILMKDPSMYLVDICMECGFSDNKYLNRMFLKKFGCTASEYRKKRILPAADELMASEPSSYSEYHYPRRDCLLTLAQYLGDEEFERLSR